MNPWPVASMLAACTRAGALASLSYAGLRRHPEQCTGRVAFLLSMNRDTVYTVADIRAALSYAYSGRRVNSCLQKLVQQGEVRVARLGNPKGYQWAA